MGKSASLTISPLSGKRDPEWWSSTTTFLCWDRGDVGDPDSVGYSTAKFCRRRFSRTGCRSLKSVVTRYRPSAYARTPCSLIRRATRSHSKKSSFGEATFLSLDSHNLSYGYESPCGYKPAITHYQFVVSTSLSFERHSNRLPKRSRPCASTSPENEKRCWYTN